MRFIMDHFFHAAHCAVWCLVWHLTDAYFGLTRTIFAFLGIGF